MIESMLSFILGTPLVIIGIFLFSLRQSVSLTINVRAIVLFVALFAVILGFTVLLLRNWTGVLYLLVGTSPFNLLTAIVLLIREKRSLQELRDTRAKAHVALQEGRWSEYRMLEATAEIYASNLKGVKEVHGNQINLP